MEKLFRILECPFIWLSHRKVRAESPQKATADDAIGVDVDTGEPFRLAAADLSKHCYILGATGCGKTTFIVNLMAQDIAQGHALVVLDLRGDLISGALSLCASLDIPPSRISLIDLREKERIQGFNPLAGAGEPFIRALHVLDVVAQEAESWGVQLEETLRCTLLLLAEAKQPLTNLELLFYDASFRAQCINALTDESLIRFWERFDALGPEKQQTLALPVLNKVTSLLAVPSLRQVLSGEPDLKLGKRLDTPGHIILVSLAVDELHRSSRMVGSLLVSAIAREMMARVNVAETKRNPVRLYVDEFENMASESFEGLIAEGRRFKLSLVLSHQTLSQLGSRLRSVVRNNVGIQLLFQCGFEDAQNLTRELPEGLSGEDLRRLPVGQAVVMKRDGEASVIQFRAPQKPVSADRLAAYRDSVLAELPAAGSYRMRTPKPALQAPKPNPSPVDPGDWL